MTMLEDWLNDIESGSSDNWWDSREVFDAVARRGIIDFRVVASAIAAVEAVGRMHRNYPNVPFDHLVQVFVDGLAPSRWPRWYWRKAIISFLIWFNYNRWQFRWWRRRINRRIGELIESGFEKITQLAQWR